MKFFFPDSHDCVDPSFDFVTEQRSEFRIRHRDDVYAHQIFARVPYDGILVSKAIVDGMAGSSGKYTVAQRQRLLRCGVRDFFRLDGTPLETMGDCGAFTYVKEAEPPFSVDDVLDFYVECGFDYGLAVDHVILGFDADLDDALPGVKGPPPEWVERRLLTIKLAEQFFARHSARNCSFTPIGVAQGWSPSSYARSVEELQALGYKRIALGGMVPLKTDQIVATVEGVSAVRKDEVEFHLLGVNRYDCVELFRSRGVTSFDTTSPLRQAFKDDRDNYHTLDRTYTAIRVPQVEGNPRIGRRIRSGEVDQGEALRLESLCLRLLREYDASVVSLSDTLDVLEAYESLYDGKTKRRAIYEEVLKDRPWNDCGCEICDQLGVHVLIFRGAERNRRRGLHNLYNLRRRLDRTERGESMAYEDANVHDDTMERIANAE